MQLGVDRRMLTHAPWGLLGATFSICALGIWNLSSASTRVWTSQLVFLAFSTSAMVAVSLVDYRLLQRLSWPIYLLNIAALIALRFIGHKAKGAESWFVVGPIRVQPAEFMKLGVVLMLAKFYQEEYRPQEPAYGLLRLWKPLVLFGLPFVLVLVQPDLGTALMLLLTSLTVILFGRIKRWMWVAMAVVPVLGGAVIWNDYVREAPSFTVVRHRLKKHQSLRISGWLDPESDLRGTGYHAAQSKIAVGSGGLWGKGWRKGTQNALSFLPEQHTDFIFSVWAEEHGFMFSLVLLTLYGVLLIAALGVAFTARERYGAFLAVGVAAMIFWQVFENIGMVIGLLPVTGITLPLMSYGGSSLLSVMLGIGLLVNVGMRRHVF